MGSFGFSQIFFASSPSPYRLCPCRGPTGTENLESPPHQKFREKLWLYTTKNAQHFKHQNLELQNF